MQSCIWRCRFFLCSSPVELSLPIRPWSFVDISDDLQQPKTTTTTSTTTTTTTGSDRFARTLFFWWRRPATSRAAAAFDAQARTANRPHGTPPQCWSEGEGGAAAERRPTGQTTGTRAREGEVHIKNDALRRLSLEPGPQRSDRTPRRTACRLSPRPLWRGRQVKPSMEPRSFSSRFERWRGRGWSESG